MVSVLPYHFELDPESSDGRYDINDLRQWMRLDLTFLGVLSSARMLNEDENVLQRHPKGFKENATGSRASYLRDSSSRFCTNCLNPYTQNIYCTDYKPLRRRTRIRLELPDRNVGFRRPLHWRWHAITSSFEGLSNCDARSIGIGVSFSLSSNTSSNTSLITSST